MSVLIMDQRKSSMPVVSIVNPKTGNTKLIINEIDFIPGQHVRWETFIDDEKIKAIEEAEAAAAAAIVPSSAPAGEDATKEEVASAKRERVVRAQREKDVKVTPEEPADMPVEEAVKE